MFRTLLLRIWPEIKLNMNENRRKTDFNMHRTMTDTLKIDEANQLNQQCVCMLDEVV
jgi:hypothetical protein